MGFGKTAFRAKSKAASPLRVLPFHLRTTSLYPTSLGVSITNIFWLKWIFTSTWDRRHSANHTTSPLVPEKPALQDRSGYAELKLGKTSEFVHCVRCSMSRVSRIEHEAIVSRALFVVLHSHEIILSPPLPLPPHLTSHPKPRTPHFTPHHPATLCTKHCIFETSASKQ